MVFRTYPALRYLILLVMGILAADTFSLSTVILGLGVTAAIGCLSLWVRPLRHIVPFTFFFLGVALCSMQQNRSIPALHEAEEVLVEINGYTESKPGSYKTTCQVLAQRRQGTWQTAAATALLYFNRNVPEVPQYGEIYAIKGPLREIAPPKTHDEFDYKRFLGLQQIYHQKFLNASDFSKLGKSTRLTLHGMAHRANVYMHEVFTAVLNEPAELGVAEAMVGGLRAALDAETLAWYTNTGTVHALAVSGMHVAILFWVINAFFGYFMNRQRWPFLLTILCCLWAYALFTGLSPSVCRSTLMFSMFQVGMFLNRAKNPVNTLLFSALLLLMLVPNWLWDVGFQLSYLAVLGILIFYPWLKGKLHFGWRPLQWLWEATAVSIAAQAYTLPLTLYYFHQFPNYMLFINPIVGLLAMPMLPVGLLLLFLFKVPYVGMGLGYVFKGLIVGMNAAVRWVHDLPGAVTEGLALSFLGVVLMYGILLTFQAYIRYRQIKWLQVSCVGIVLLMLWGVGKRGVQFKQQELTFHALPKSAAISLVSGRTAIVLAADSLLVDPKIDKYYLRNYYNARGVAKRRNEVSSSQENEIVYTAAGSIYWVKAGKGQAFRESDYTLVSSNALDLDAAKKAKVLLLDGSNGAEYIQRVRARVPSAIVLQETGTQTFSM